MGSRGKPANAKSAYNFFTSIMHEEFKAVFPGKTVDFIDFQRKCAGKWKLLSPEDKTHFEKIASLDKQRFQEEVKIFPSPSPSVKDGGKDKKKKKYKDPNEPKRPLSAFFLFSNQKRVSVKSANPEFSVGEIGRKLGEMWRNLSEESKRPFEERAKRAKERYGRAMEAFKEGRPFEGEEEEAVPEAKVVDNFENLDVLLNDSIVQDEPLPAEAEAENFGLSMTEFEKLDRLLEDSMKADEDETMEKSQTSGSKDADIDSKGSFSVDEKQEKSEDVDNEPKDSDSVVDQCVKNEDVDAEPKDSDSSAVTPDEQKEYKDNVDATPGSNEVPVRISNEDDQELSFTTQSSLGVEDINSEETQAASEPLPKASDGKTLSEPAKLSGAKTSKDAESASPKGIKPSRDAGKSVDAFEKLDECLGNDSDFEGFDELDSLL